MVEDGVKLSLTVVDSPGYGDWVDNTDCWEPGLQYIERQFDKFLAEETRVERARLPDTRVHACLFFLPPNGHGLKNIDIACMQRLHRKVSSESKVKTLTGGFTSLVGSFLLDL